MMSDTFRLVLAWLAGAGLGGMFFGGLWWTVRAGMSSQRPALLFLGSAVLRMGAAVGGFFLVSGGNWQRLLLCLLGFVIAKPVVTWVTRPPGQDRTRRDQEANHAS
jgi:F1F0 ATPase subunit 2